MSPHVEKTILVMQDVLSDPVADCVAHTSLFSVFSFDVDEKLGEGSHDLDYVLSKSESRSGPQIS